MYRRRQYQPKRRYAKKKTGAKRLSKPMRAAVARVAKRVVSRAAENKLIGHMVEDGVAHNSAISSADCYPIITEIQQLNDIGSTAPSSCARVGDRITPKSLTVKGVLSINPEQGTNSVGDIYARIIIATQKDLKSGAAISAGGVDAGALLRPGFDTPGNDQVAFDGNTMRLNYPINTNLFNVYMDKVVRFKQTKSLTQDAWVDYSHRWSYTFKRLPTSLTFDEGNGNWPNNFAPFVAVGYAYADGSVPDTIQLKLLHNCFSQLKFEDM